MLKYLKKDFLFVLLFTAMACFYYDSVLHQGPLNIHLWRQTDCLSLARNYAKGAPFFKGEMCALLGDDFTTGLTAGEFPVLYYTVGQFWKIWGESYFSYRVFYLLILFGGIFAFYKALRITFGDFAVAVLMAALLFTAPVLVVYGVSFLTDAPAFSFVLMALYFFVRYIKDQKYRFLSFCLAFFALAGLIKVSSLMIFFFLFMVLLAETLSFKSLGNNKTLFRVNRWEWLGFLSVFAVVFSWYLYAHYFNELHRFKYTFNNIYPLWIVPQEQLKPLLSEVQVFASYVFFSRPVIVLLFGVGTINLFLWKKLPPLAYWGNLVILSASALYFVLWAPLLGVHDYYYVALLALFIGVFMPFLWFVKSHHPKVFGGYVFKMVLAGFLVYNFLYCNAVVRLKTGTAPEREYAIVGNDEFVERMQWANWDTQDNLKRFERMPPYLETIGIKPDDKIISLPDFSFNTTLYLSGHRGWTNELKFSKPEEIERLRQKGAAYLFISDPAVLQEEYVRPFIHQKIGNFEGVDIFKL